MSKRNTQQRRHIIITEVNSVGEVSVEALAKRFDISEVTIRKDLAALEKSGLLLRRYGGAVPLPNEITEAKESKVSVQKQAIAKAAASLIKDHYRVVIDSGRTTSTIIEYLAEKRGLVVMTNSMKIAGRLHELESEPTILMTGGTWDPTSESFQGQIAEQVLRSYDFDQLFIGADGIDVERGTTTFNELIGLSRVMAEVAREVIVVVESEKIGRKIPNLELTWQQVDTLITDELLNESVKKQLIECGVNVVIAPLNK
ncbi:XRE family transcriptional regulator [Thalassotalea loyana]|uniref:XRE family transcriptional regulator n=1 Tax=Thalassotalea loyana TaxID=280483 RepID=A0ABQ6HH96_9GAMM|nr:DeoR family transcriptional regulator [Thalassotalea loyana]GLX86072.1 XRE family transcriptional regulator [Thalassotalea loyana]